MSMAPQALERSVLERKERDELAAIAEAMGVKPASRASKATLIDQILREAGIETAAPERPKRTRTSQPSRYGGGLSGGRLLVGDLRTISMFVNESRYRAFERVLGLPREEANLATAVAILATAEAMRVRGGRLRLPVPSFGELAFGSAAFKEAILGPPKPGAPAVPMFSGLVAIAAAGTLAAAAGKSLHGMRTASHAFVNRYGQHARRARGAIAGRARRLRADEHTA